MVRSQSAVGMASRVYKPKSCGRVAESRQEVSRVGSQATPPQFSSLEIWGWRLVAHWLAREARDAPRERGLWPTRGRSWKRRSHSSTRLPVPKAATYFAQTSLTPPRTSRRLGNAVVSRGYRTWACAHYSCLCHTDNDYRVPRLPLSRCPYRHIRRTTTEQRTTNPSKFIHQQPVHRTRKAVVSLRPSLVGQVFGTV